MALAVSILFAASISFAAGVINIAGINEIHYYPDGLVIVDFDENMGGSPAACGAKNNNTLAFSTKTEEGKILYTSLYGADLAEKKVYAVGTGKCEHFSDIESLSWIKVKK